MISLQLGVPVIVLFIATVVSTIALLIGMIALSWEMGFIRGKQFERLLVFSIAMQRGGYVLPRRTRRSTSLRARVRA